MFTRKSREATQAIELNDFLDISREASSQLVANLTRAAELVSLSNRWRPTAATRISVPSISGSNRAGFPESAASLGKQMSPKRRVPTDLTMNSYPGPYGQVLTNLLLNSIAHAFPGGKGGIVDVKAQASGMITSRVFFPDDGWHESRCRRKAFDPSSRRVVMRGGTGLGLHIRLLHRHKFLGAGIFDSEPNQGRKCRSFCRAWHHRL